MYIDSSIPDSDLVALIEDTNRSNTNDPCNAALSEIFIL
jgi:hypothetical protein